MKIRLRKFKESVQGFLNPNRLISLQVSLVFFAIIALGGLAWIAKDVLKQIIQTKVSSSLALHEALHKTGAKLLEREVVDLQTQLETSLGKTVDGTFEIFQSPKGLMATHSAVPNSPIEIESLSGTEPFAQLLDVDSQVRFSVFNKEAYLLSFSDHFERRSATEIFSQVLRVSRATLSRETGDANLPTQFWFGGSNFKDASRLASAPSTRDWLSDQKHSLYLMSSVKGTNLYILSRFDFPTVLPAMITNLVKPMMAWGITIVCLALCVWSFYFRTRRNSLEWIQKFLSQVRFGRVENLPKLSSIESGLNPFEKNILHEIVTQLSGSGVFTETRWGKWIDQNRKIATWKHFSDQVALCSLGRSGQGTEVGTGRLSFVAKLRFKNSKVQDQVIRFLNKAFLERGIIFCVFSETEIRILGRAHQFEEWVYRAHKAIRTVIHLENLSLGDIEFLGILIPHRTTHKTQEIMNRLETLNYESANEKQEVTLETSLLNFFSIEEMNRAVTSLNWSQILAMPLSEFENFLYFSDLKISSKILEKTFESPNVKLPQTPSIHAFSKGTVSMSATKPSKRLPPLPKFKVKSESLKN